jgi:hypothetical protein
MMFLDCPAYLDQDGAARCGLPAEVTYRFIMSSTDGPLESAMIRCPAGHWFNGPIEFLTWDRTDKRDRGAAAVASSVTRDSLAGSDDRLDLGGGSAVRVIPAGPEGDVPRPNSAPAYYLGRPAHMWITAMRPGSERTASHHLVGAPTAADTQRHRGAVTSAADSADSHAQLGVPGQSGRTAMPVPERKKS